MNIENLIKGLREAINEAAHQGPNARVVLRLDELKQLLAAYDDLAEELANCSGKSGRIREPF